MKEEKKITIEEAMKMDGELFAEACEDWFGNRAYNSALGNSEDTEISNHNAQVLGKALRERLI